MNSEDARYRPSGPIGQGVPTPAELELARDTESLLELIADSRAIESAKAAEIERLARIAAEIGRTRREF